VIDILELPGSFGKAMDDTLFVTKGISCNDVKQCERIVEQRKRNNV
jgi:hypothetical protein